MNYIDINDLNSIKNDKMSNEFIKEIAGEVEEFFSNFNDDPIHLSQWAHHYFCKDDGGLLVFDAKKPNEHTCSVCGKTYIDDELYNGVWTTMYRNLGATSAWKAAVLYKVTQDKKYLEYVMDFALYYTNNYHKFQLHKKDGIHDTSKSEVEWGCARIMPQSLNECIFIIRLVNALELIKNELSSDFISNIENKFFNVAFEDIKPQVDAVHNIRCWFNSAIVVMGLFLGNEDMINFAYNNDYNITRQLTEGVTSDNFWYEGSIHYNFFLLEAIVNQLLFCKLYGRDYVFGEEVVEKMLISAYNYAFDNHQFPNPNDGWPNINLKTYSYIYAMAVKVYGKDSKVADILASILNKDSVRGTLPLSRPYFYKNDLSLEEFLFAQGVRAKDFKLNKAKAYNFETSYCGMVKNDNVNVFVKYGHNGPSHAHNDKMNIEVMINDLMLSRDLSNPGYGHPLCDEWHRISASHNTVLVDGESHTNKNDGGECIEFTGNSIKVKCRHVYTDVDFGRNLVLNDNGFTDRFDVLSSDSHTYDYIFHVEGKLLSDVEMKDGNLGYSKNGYQHIANVKEIITADNSIDLLWDVKGLTLKSNIMIGNKKLYIAQTPDNPVNNKRTAIIIRSKGENATYIIKWNMEE